MIRDRKGTLDHRDIFVRQFPPHTASVFDGVLRPAGLWNGENAGVARQKIQSYLSRSAAVTLGDSGQHAAPDAPRGRKLLTSERAVGDDGDFLALAVRQQAPLNAAFLEMVEHLIRSQALVAQRV
jgi:hypothetical protein